MPLPTENEVWPPREWALAFDQFASNDVWFRGSEADLAEFYAGHGATSNSRGDDPRSHYNSGTPSNASVGRKVWRAITRPFWGRANDRSASSGAAAQNRSRLHSPLAGNLATLSADLLFSEPPMHLLIADGEDVKGDAQDRFDKIANGDDMHMTLSQAGEFAAGIGGAVLTAHWDPDRTDRPWIQAAGCDVAVPEYEGSRTVALNLWTTHADVTVTNVVQAVYYHVERHELGAIVHALYRGTQSTIGERVPLTELPTLAHIAGIRGAILEGDTVRLPTGVPDRLTAQYWRNLPTRTFRKDATLSRIGRADFEGVENMLSEVDAVWSSWMRDIKIARARLIVPSSFLDVSGPGAGGAFDDDQEILTALEYADGTQGAGGVKDQISAQQFEIRYLEHASTILALVKEVLQHAGYSLSSYGEYGDAKAKTATEVVDRTTATERTRDKKALYYKQAAAPLLETLLELDRIHYNGPGLPAGAEVEIRFPELSQQDPEKLARTIALLRSAQAASTRTLVAMQHEDWDAEEQDAEVQRILAEQGLSEEAAEPEEDPAALERVDPLLPPEPVDADATDPAPGERVAA